MAKNKYQDVDVQVRGGGKLPDLIAVIRNWVPVHAGGDPKQFHHHLLVASCLNDSVQGNGLGKKLPLSAEDKKNAEDMRDLLEQIPNVFILGPGNEDLWGAAGFDQHARAMMDILWTAGHPMYDGYLSSNISELEVQSATLTTSMGDGKMS